MLKSCPDVEDDVEDLEAQQIQYNTLHQITAKLRQKRLKRLKNRLKRLK